MKHRNELFPCLNGLVFLALALAVNLASLTALASPPAGYYEVWGDEFAGTSLDTTKWVYWLYPGNYKNATLSQSAVSESGNHVVITTYTSGSTEYTAMISSQGKFQACYGYFEANIQWADNTGMWSAFWLQSPEMGSWIGDPALGGAEIDVCEHRLEDGTDSDANINNYVQSNIHINGYGSSEDSYGSGNYTDTGGTLSSGFHKYGVLWTSSGYTFYVDDGEQAWASSSGVSARTEFIILSSIVDDTDTTWAGDIPSGGYGSLSSSSTKLAVDYVRYYAPNNSIFWTGASSPYWFDTNNWISYTTAPASGNDVVFSMLTTGNYNMTLDQNLTINSLSIWETSPLTLSSNTLTINSSVDMDSAYNDATINSAVVLGNANSWTIGSGRTFKVNGPVSGGHSLHLEGYGTVALSNTNSYTLGTFIDNGILQLINGSALGPTNVGTFVASGGELQIYGSFTCNQPLTLNGTTPAMRVSAGASAVWTGLITLTNAAMIQLDGGTALAIDGGVTGGHTLYLAGDGGSEGVVNGGIATGAFPVTKSGAGTWILSGTNTFTGALNVDSDSTTANDGDLVINSSNSASTASVIQIQNNNSASSTLQLDGSQGNFAVPQPITLNARNSTVPAIENLAGSNTLSGGIAVNSGGAYYEVQSDTGTLNLGGGISSAVTGMRIFTFQGTGNILVSGVISNGSATTFSLNQAGPGDVTLAAANTYNGSTTINGGTLALGPAGSILNSPDIFVTNGATLDVSQAGGGFVLSGGQTLAGGGVVTGSVTCASSAVISPGNGVSEVTLNFSNNLVLGGGATCQFDLANVAVEGGGTNDEILVAGNLNLSGTNALSINPIVGLLASGRYTVIRYAGTMTGGATNFAVVFTGVPPQAALTLDSSIAGEIDLVVSAFPGNLVWQGDGAANVWNSGGSSNWFNGAATVAFYPGDSVTFDNTSTNPTVNLSGTVSPGLITMNGTSNYVFTGSGKITGITGIVKNNTGTLTVLTTNSYTGATEINAGTVLAGNGTTAGSLGTGNIIVNGALTYNHADTEIINGAISGTGSLTNLGTGVLNLNGNNSFSGGTTLSQGMIIASNSTVFGLGPVTINNSATQMVLAAGITITNPFTVSPGVSSGLFASGIIKGPASGSATLSGPMTITASTGAGGHFDGGNTTGGLIFNGPITASAAVRHRANRAVFAGGGSYTAFWSEGTTVLGANNGLATNAVADLGYSGAAGILDLAGFNQTLNGLVKGSQTATVGNSSTNNNSMLTISGVSSNTAYAGTIQDSVSGGTSKVFLTVNGGTFTLSAANTFSGDTELTGGTLALSSSTALQDSPLNLAAADSGVLSFTTLTTATLGGLKGSRSLALTNSSGAAVALTVGNSSTNIYTYSGALTGSGSVTKSSACTVVLNGTNTFTGVLNTDTGQPSVGNDGILYLASPGAMNGAASIAIRNENSAYSILQLDGTAGNINLVQAISLNGRNNAVAAIENVTGTNSFSGNLSLGSGGGTYTIQSDSGNLTFSGILGVQSLTSPRTLTFQGAGNVVISGVITNGTSFANAVVKTGAGTLTLTGSNSYAGPTTNFTGTLLVNGVIGTNILIVSGGTLGGGGLIRGAVTLQSGGTLSPGAIAGTISTLTISNSLTLSGTALMGVNKSLAGINDLVRAGSVAFGGTLMVTNLGSAFAAGDSFKFFSATNYSGSFAALNLPAPGPGLAWNTNSIATGVLSIFAVAPPQFGSFAQTGDGNFQFNGTGTADVTYELDAATNLTPPVAWSFVTNMVANQNGQFQLSDQQATNFNQRFYRMTSP